MGKGKEKITVGFFPKPQPSLFTNKQHNRSMIDFKEHTLQQRDDLLGLNTFSKTYGIDRRTVERMVERGCLDAMEILDGEVKRVFINNSTVFKEARLNDMTPQQWVRWLVNHSKQ
jgi:hypothetical protein